MSNTWGKILKLSIFGESHGEAVGIVIDGLPPGFEIDLDYLKEKMALRAPGGPLASQRKEEDQVEILSGFFQGKATGTPLCGLIRNTDVRSDEYRQNLPRPSTADYSGQVKYKGFNDYRGGGHFSGRLTGPLTFAGSLARQYLLAEDIEISSSILSIGDVSADQGPKALADAIKAAGKEGDSLGGIISCEIRGIPAGLGSPFFNSLESSIASLAFSIPGVKGIEFGAGFDLARMKGSEANDPFYYENGKVLTKTNMSGGINGGISNGMPITFNLAIRPTPSIKKVQDTVNLKTGENTKIQIEGRHDPCILPRALVVVESAAALCLMDALLESRCY